MDDFRHWLVRRIEIETSAFHNAEHQTRQIRWGLVLAYLEVGVRSACGSGYWSERTSSRVSGSIHYGRRREVSRSLLRG